MTDKQAEANRRNSLNSTGPKSATGKARSSKNALKHGAFAAPIIEGLESRDDWKIHRERVQKSIAPVGELENLLTDELVVILWKIKRLERFETELLPHNAPQWNRIWRTQTDLLTRSQNRRNGPESSLRCK